MAKYSLLASNFGNLPAILPIFWLGIIISIIVAIILGRKKDQEEDSFKFENFFTSFLIGISLTFAISILLWLTTLEWF